MAKNNISRNCLSGQAPRPKNEETINFLDGFGFDPAWSVEQAVEADNAGGPFSPLSRWLAWKSLDDKKQTFEAGNRQSLLSAVRTCAAHGLPFPDWLADSYCKSHDSWVTYRAPSLDEAFNVKIPKGAHLNALRKARRLRLAVPMRVNELHREGKAIDEKLFAEVGKEMGISGSSVRDYYYPKTKTS